MSDHKTVIDMIHEAVEAIAANETTPILFQLSPGQAADAPQGRILIQKLSEYYQNNNIPC